MDPKLITALRSASRVVVFTGAGVSAESGIPTFRDKQTGLWENFDAAELATYICLATGSGNGRSPEGESGSRA